MSDIRTEEAHVASIFGGWETVAWHCYAETDAYLEDAQRRITDLEAKRNALALELEEQQAIIAGIKLSGPENLALVENIIDFRSQVRRGRAAREEAETP